MPLVRDKLSSKEHYTAFLELLNNKYPEGDKIRIVLDSLRFRSSEGTRQYLTGVPKRFEVVFAPTHGA